VIEKLLGFRKHYLVSNISWVISANIIVKIIALFYTIFLARSLGPSNFGIHVFGLTAFGLVSTLTDFGYNRLLTREVAKDKRQMDIFLGNIISLSLFWSVISAIFIGYLMFLIDSDVLRRSASMIFILTIIPNTLAATLLASLSALEKFKSVAISTVFLSLAVTILGTISIIVFKSGVIGIAITFLIAHIILFSFLLFCSIKNKFKIKFLYDFNFWQKTFKQSLPYGILTILGLLYFKIDTILLTVLKGNEITGYYGASYRFLESVHFIPASVMMVLFPVMSRLHKGSVFELKKLYLRSMLTLGVVSIPVFLFLLVFAEVIITTLYGNMYQPSIAVLKILSVAVIFMFLHVPGAHLLFATEKYLKTVVVLSVFTVLLNIVLNLIFIPRYGILAASIITVISEAISFVIFSLLIWLKVLKLDEGKI